MKRVAGDDLLEALVRSWMHDGPTHARALALDLGFRDARSIAPALAKLEDAGLASRTPNLWRPTSRGIEVDGILARITAARGGTFMPRSKAGLTVTECLAL